MTERIRVGVVGIGRGLSFADGASELVGMELVALCDTWEEKLREAGKKYQVATYTDYDQFLTHEMDAVVLANYFHEHTPFAIKALAAGKHVMSETPPRTPPLAEGVGTLPRSRGEWLDLHAGGELSLHTVLIWRCATCTKPAKSVG